MSVTPERIHEAHSKMTRADVATGVFNGHQAHGFKHRIYTQDWTEGCYICELLNQLATVLEERDRQKIEIKEMRETILKQHDFLAEVTKRTL